MANCPECDAELEIENDDLDEMEVGDPWDCEACGSRLRVASVEPLEFDSDDEDEDEEEEDDDDSDDSDDEEDVDDEDEADKDGGDWDE
jgi:lysine biosynthesis protein LysW